MQRKTVHVLKYGSNRGFALLGALLLLLAITGLAVGMMYLVNSEQKLSGSDRETTESYYAAQSGMEKMMADLDGLYVLKQAPTVADITGLQSSKPNLPGITYGTYLYNVGTAADGVHPASTNHVISTGANAGLSAQIINLTLQVQAQRVSGTQTSMSRGIEVALIPVFQFGAFSDTDMSFFAGPAFDFTGRVHANGNLFLASGTSLTFHNKITTAGEVIRAQLENGHSGSHNGPVYIPQAALGCDGAQPACRNLALTEGSVTGGPGSSPNPGWPTLSQSTYNGQIRSKSTGVKRLVLPFVSPGVTPIELIRQPRSGELVGSAVGQSRLYNLAQIRVVLADDPVELPGGASDAQNIQLDNVFPYASGVPVTGATPTYFGRGLDPATAPAPAELDWVLPTQCPGYVGATTTCSGSTTASSASWPLIGGYLRVEYRKSDGTYAGVTQEWLQLGFARGLLPPNSELGITNTVHPNAILILQQQDDRNGNTTLTSPADVTAGETTIVAGAAVVNNWLPINIYDTREGELRDVQQPAGNQSCAIGGVMNLVELDVNNLRNWLLGTIGASGTSVESASQNGYIMYFSDRRGMLVDPFYSRKTGAYGFGDVVNPGSSSVTPNGILDTGEDSGQDGNLKTYGSANIGDGFGVANGDPTLRLTNCMTTGRKNRVTGARHALRVVNGSLGNVPTKADGSGGFTVASEQPVYLQGNYNANNSGFGTPHSESAIIGDTVTLLSNNWNDYESFLYPTQPGNRGATTTWYRVAIASGTTLSFPQPSWGAADFGTDGGIHNFLRYLESWGGLPSNYEGSIVMFYPAQYNTGTYKCCSTVYSPPTRAYAFDTDFLDPSKLPPGTPRFRDIVNLGYHQDFTPY